MPTIESGSPAWLNIPAMTVPRLHDRRDRHYVESVTATTHQGKGIITFVNPLMENCATSITWQRERLVKTNN